MLELEIPMITVKDLYRTLRERLTDEEKDELQAMIDDVSLTRNIDKYRLDEFDYGD